MAGKINEEGNGWSREALQGGGMKDVEAVCVENLPDIGESERKSWSSKEGL